MVSSVPILIRVTSVLISSSPSWGRGRSRFSIVTCRGRGNTTVGLSITVTSGCRRCQPAVVCRRSECLPWVSHVGLTFRFPDFCQTEEVSYRSGRLEPAAEDGVGHFRDQDVALWSDCNPVRSDQLTATVTLTIVAQARLQSSVERVDAHAWTHAWSVPCFPEIRQPLSPPNRAELPYVTELLGTARVDTQAARQRHPAPDMFELAVRCEHLHAIVVPVGDIDVAVAVGSDVVRQIELARIVARLAPRVEQTAVGRILVDLGVEITVGDEKVAGVRINGDMSALVERLAAHCSGGSAAHADRHQDLPVARAFSHRMVENIGEPDAILRADRNTVGAREHLLVAPALKELSVAIEDYDRAVAAIEHIDAALGVDGDSGDVVGPLVGHFAPFFDDFVEVVAAAGQ